MKFWGGGVTVDCTAQLFFYKIRNPWYILLVEKFCEHFLYLVNNLVEKFC